MSESLVEGKAGGGTSEGISEGNGLATTDGFWIIEERVGYCDGTWLGTIDGSSLDA